MLDQSVGGLKCSVRLRKALVRAREIGAKRGNPALTPEALAIALLDSKGVAVTALRRLGVALASAKHAVLDHYNFGEVACHRFPILRLRVLFGRLVRVGSQAEDTSRPTPTLDAVSPVLHQARQEAKSLNHFYVGTEHVFLALLKPGDALSELFGREGIHYDSFKEAVKIVLRMDTE